MQESAIVLTGGLDAPLASAAEAKAMWDQYRELEAAILEDEDYMWFLEFQEFDNNGRPRTRRYTYPNRAKAEEEQKKRAGSTIMKRKVKSACRKLAKFFGYEIPQQGTGDIETRTEGDYIVIIERGEFYTHSEWLGENLKTIKASSTVFIRSPHGRTWMGKGGAHMSEGFDDFAVGETAFTRAVNRAILDAVGFGDSSAEETLTTEPIPGEAPPPAQAQGRPAGNQQRGKRPARTPEQEAGIKAIQDLVKELNLDPEAVSRTIGEEFEKTRLAQLTPEQMTELAEVLKRNKADAGGPDPDLVIPADSPEGAEAQSQADSPPTDSQAENEGEGQASDDDEVLKLAQEMGYGPEKVPSILGSNQDPMTLSDWITQGHSHEDAIRKIREYHLMDKGGRQGE